MSKAAPWNIKGLDYEVRSAAKDAARRAGMSLSDWLDDVVEEQAYEMGLDPDDFDDHDRDQIVTAHINAMAKANHRRARRGDRPVAPAAYASDFDDDRYDNSGLRYRPSSHRPSPRARKLEVPYENQGSPSYQQDTPAYQQGLPGYQDRTGSKDIRRTLSRLEARMEALAAHGKDTYGEDTYDDDHDADHDHSPRHRGQATRDQAGRIQKRLGQIGNSLHDRAPAGGDKELRRTLSRLEARIESVAGGKEAETSFESMEDMDRKLTQITEMLTRKPGLANNARAQNGRATADLDQENGVRPRELARIEAKLNSLLSRESGQAQVLAATSGPTPAKRSIAESVAEIQLRQHTLDGHAAPEQMPARQPLSQTPARTPLGRPIERPLSPSLRASLDPMPEQAPDQAPELAPASSRAQTNESDAVRDDLRLIASKLDELRNGRPANAEAQPVQSASTPDSGAIEKLSQQIAALNQAMSGLAPQNSITAIEAAIRDLGARVDKSRQDGLSGKALQPIEKLITDLKTSVNDRDSNAPSQPLLDELRNQLADVKHVVSKLAPKNALAAIEVAIRDLSKRVDNSRQEGVKENILAPIETLIGDLKSSFANRSADPQLDTIERELHAIGQRMDQLSAAGADDPKLKEIHQQTSSIKELLSAAVARPMPVEKIERQINALGKRIDLIASRGSSPVGAAAVNENVEEIRASLQHSYPALEFSTIQDRIEALSNKFDEVIAKSSSSHHMDDLSSRIDAVQQSISQRLNQPTTEETQSARKLERLMLDIRDRLDTAKSAPSEAHAIAALPPAFEDHIRSLAEKIETVASPVSLHHIAGLEDNIRALAEKIDTIVTGTGETNHTANAINPQHIAALEENIRSLSDKIDDVSSNKEQNSITELEAQVREIAERIDHPAVSMAALNTIEETMQGLLNQFEEARLSTADAAEAAARSATRDALDELLTRGALANIRNDDSRELISREISGLRTDQEAKDQRTHATLSAVHETLEKVVDRLAMLEDNIDTRSAVAEAGRGPAIGRSAAAAPVNTAGNTASNFTADMEAPHARGSTGTPAREAEPPMQPADDGETLVSGPAPLFQRKPPAENNQQDMDRISATSALGKQDDVNAAPEQSKQKKHDPRTATNKTNPLNLDPAAAALWDDDDDEVLLEPGSGAPKVQVARPTAEPATGTPAQAKTPIANTPVFEAPNSRAANISDNDDAAMDAISEEMADRKLGVKSSSSFIAAARRASIAAQAEAEAENAAATKSRKRSRSGKDSSLSDARARAMEAAASLAGKLDRKKKDKQKYEGSGAGEQSAGKRSMLRNRKVLLSLGLAAAVLVLGTLQFLRTTGGTPQKSSSLNAPKALSTESAKVAKLGASSSGPAQPNVAGGIDKSRIATPKGATARIPAPAKTPPVQQGALLNNSFSKTRLPNAGINNFVKAPNGVSMPVDRTAVATINGSNTRLPAITSNNLYKASAAGDPRAQYELALRLMSGRTMPRNNGKAFGLLEKAAARGLAPAQYRLASMFEKGIGTEKDNTKALSLYESAANAGNIRAMHNYAVLLADGAGKKPNYPLAANWFRKAAEHGIRDSQYNLAILYARGLGISRSMSQSYKWFAVAAAQGDKDAASKRDQVARRLSANELARAKQLAADFKPRAKIAAANTVAQPAGGWIASAPAATKPAKNTKRKYRRARKSRNKV